MLDHLAKLREQGLDVIEDEHGHGAYSARSNRRRGAPRALHERAATTKCATRTTGLNGPDRTPKHQGESDSVEPVEHGEQPGMAARGHQGGESQEDQQHRRQDGDEYCCEYAPSLLRLPFVDAVEQVLCYPLANGLRTVTCWPGPQLGRALTGSLFGDPRARASRIRGSTHGSLNSARQEARPVNRR